MGQQCRSSLEPPLVNADTARNINFIIILQKFHYNIIKYHRTHSTVHHSVAIPFPMSTSGNRYIVVIKDAITKGVKPYPIPDTKAETIAAVMVDEVICRYGPPKEPVIC